MIFFPQMILFPLSLSEEDNEQQQMESELQEMRGRALRISKKVDADEYAIFALNVRATGQLTLCPSLPTLEAAKAALLMILAAK